MLRLLFTIFVCQEFLFLVTCQEDVYESLSNTKSSSVVLLGGLFPVHDTVSGNVLCGDLSEEGVQRVESMAYAIEQINNRKDLLPNITLAFSIRDTCASSRRGLDQAFRFVQAARSGDTCGGSSNRSRVSISGVVGAQFSRVSIDVAKLLGLYRIPQISYISTAVELGEESLYDYFFRTIPPDNLQAKAIVDIIVKFNWTFVYAFYSGNDTYGEGGIKAVKEYLAEAGSHCIAADIPLPVTEDNEEVFDGAVRNMTADFIRNATVAIIFGQRGTAIGMIRAVGKARRSGITGLDNITWIGTDTWGDSLPEKYRKDAGGIIGILPRAENDTDFDEHFIHLTPENTTNIWFSELWENTFNCTISSNSSCVEENMWDRASHTQASQLTLVEDAVYAFAHAIHNLVERNCSNGKLCDAIVDDEMRAVNGTLIRDELYRVSFTGPSNNNVTFEREEKGSFFIKNMQRSFNNQYTFEIVGSWDGELNLMTERIEWVTGNVPISICSEPCEPGSQPMIQTGLPECCWTCSPCPDNFYSDGLSACRNCTNETKSNANKTECVPIPVSHLKFGEAWPIALLTLTSIGLVATICVIILFLVCYDDTIVKASSKEVSAILLTGLVVCYTMPFFFVNKPSNAMCAIRRFGVGFGFSICFSALLVKTTRIHRLFNQKTLDPRRPPRFTGPLSQVVMTLLLILVQAVIGTVWLAVDHPSTKINFGSDKGEKVCGERPMVYLLISLSYNFALLLLSTWYAFLARKVPSNFNEARYINITLYTLIIIWLAFIPIYSTTLQFGSIFQTTSFIIAIILSASTTLICIFLPKIYIMIRLKTKNPSNLGNSTIMNTNARKDSSTTKS